MRVVCLHYWTESIVIDEKIENFKSQSKTYLSITGFQGRLMKIMKLDIVGISGEGKLNTCCADPWDKCRKKKIIGFSQAQFSIFKSI